MSSIEAGNFGFRDAIHSISSHAIATAEPAVAIPPDAQPAVLKPFYTQTPGYGTVIFIGSMPVDTVTQLSSITSSAKSHGENGAIAQDTVKEFIGNTVDETAQSSQERVLRQLDEQQLDASVKKVTIDSNQERPKVKRIRYEIRNEQAIPAEERAWVGTITDENGKKKGVFGKIVGRVGREISGAELKDPNDLRLEMRVYVTYDGTNPDLLKLGTLNDSGSEVEIIQKLPLQPVNMDSYRYSGWLVPVVEEKPMSDEEFYTYRKQQKYPHLNDVHTVDLRDKKLSIIQTDDPSYQLEETGLILQEKDAYIGHVITEEDDEIFVEGTIIGRTARIDPEFPDVLIIDEYVKYEVDKYEYQDKVGQVITGSNGDLEVVVRRASERNREKNTLFSGWYKPKELVQSQSVSEFPSQVSPLQVKEHVA